jgi:hypothetical protein
MFTYSVSCSDVYLPFNLPGLCYLCSYAPSSSLKAEGIQALILLSEWGGRQAQVLEEQLIS